MCRSEPHQPRRDIAEIDRKLVIEQHIGLADAGLGEQFPVGIVARTEILDAARAGLVQFLLLRLGANDHGIGRKPALAR